MTLAQTERCAAPISGCGIFTKSWASKSGFYLTRLFIDALFDTALCASKSEHALERFGGAIGVAPSAEVYWRGPALFARRIVDMRKLAEPYGAGTG